MIMNPKTEYDYNEPLKLGDYVWLEHLSEVIEIDKQFIELSQLGTLFLAEGERWASAEEINEYKKLKDE